MLKILCDSQVLGFLRGRCRELLVTSVTSCILKSHSSGLIQGIYWRRSHKKTMPFSVTWGIGVFYLLPVSSWNRSNELDAMSLSAQVNTFSSSWISLNTSISKSQTGPWPSPPPLHGTPAPELQHQHWSHVLFADEYILSSSSVMCLAEFFVVLFKGTWIVSSNEQIAFADTTIRVVEAAPGLFIEYRMRPVLIVLVLEPVWQHMEAAAIISNQSLVSVWMSWAISSRN